MRRNLSTGFRVPDRGYVNPSPSGDGWRQHVLAGDRVATSGNVTDEAWGRYIEEQKPPEPGDDFKKVVQSAAWPIDPASSRNPKRAEA